MYRAKYLLINKGTKKDKTLFLVSTDIKIGDIVHCTHNNTSGIVTSIRKMSNRKEPRNKQPKEKIVRYGERYFTIESHIYKIIGEISIDALLYIKEEDTFTENVLFVILKSGARCYLRNVRYEDSIAKILIKGPCGHFH